MIAKQVARIIATFIVFLETTDDEALDPDDAVAMMEIIGSQIEELDKPFLRKVVDSFAEIAQEYSGEAQTLVRDIAHHFYLEEALASDDPVRLAELDAIREARP